MEVKPTSDQLTAIPQHTDVQQPGATGGGNFGKFLGTAVNIAGNLASKAAGAQTMGIGPLLPWRRASGAAFVRNVTKPAAGALATVLLLLAFGIRNPGAVLGYGACVFVMATLVLAGCIVIGCNRFPLSHAVMQMPHKTQ